MEHPYGLENEEFGRLERHWKLYNCPWMTCF